MSWCHQAPSHYLNLCGTWFMTSIIWYHITCNVNEETYHQDTLKRKCRHFDEIFITGCTGSCHFDNFQCSQWWKFHQNEDISVSVQWLTRKFLSTRPNRDFSYFSIHCICIWWNFHSSEWRFYRSGTGGCWFLSTSAKGACSWWLLLGLISWYPIFS